MNRRFALLAIVVWLAAPTASGQPSVGYQPAGLQLSWQQDPTTTITIDWHVLDPREAPDIQWRARGETTWSTARAEAFPFPFSERHVRRAELTGLVPGSAYEFRFADDGRIYTFRTLPADLSEPVRLAVGGDVRHTAEMMERTSRVAMRYDPHLVVFGGDLAYANGDPRLVENWYEWFEITRDVFVSPEGFHVPVVAGIGNHEVFSEDYLARDQKHLAAEWGLSTGDAPFFTTLFPQPSGRSYRVLDVPGYLSLILLDTGHIERIDGEQAVWLEQVLAARQHVPHVFPVYHVPGYPSVRSFDGEGSRRVREHWVPLFERYGVRLAFENHDHAYKRTVPLRGGEAHPHGIVYLGDGAWGVRTRGIGSRRSDGEEMWPSYLAHAEDTRHFILVTLHGPLRHVLVVSEHGEVIDEMPRLAVPAPADAAPRRSP